MIADRVAALDVTLFDVIPAQSTDWDRRALLAIHAAAADLTGAFAYLEVGSYLGGSLQALVRDPRCERVISIDPRPSLVPDNRGADWAYDENTSENMLRRLGTVPGADTSKVISLETTTASLVPTDLPARPTVCFVDGEHTDEAALQDARFCAAALGGEGVLAFHDRDLVRAGIRAFLREIWQDVSSAIPFNGSVFAIELGGRRMLAHPAVARAVGSSWHSAVWRATTARGAPPLLLDAAWWAVPVLDRWIARARSTVQRRR